MALQPQSGDILVEIRILNDLAPEQYNYNLQEENTGA